MTVRKSHRRLWPHGFTAVMLPQVQLAGLALLAAAPLFVIGAVVPRAAFLPSVSLAAIFAAAAAAGAAWWFGCRRHGATITLWDVAGACALIGCAAAMLSEPEFILNNIGKTSNR